MALSTHLPADIARALLTLRQLGVAAVGGLEHAACGGCRQARRYRAAPAYEERDWRDRPMYRPKPYDASGGHDS